MRHFLLFTLLAILATIRAADAEVIIKSSRLSTAEKRTITYDVLLNDYNGKTVTLTLPNAGGDAIANSATSNVCQGPKLTGESFVWTCAPKSDTAKAVIELGGSPRRLQYGSIEASVRVADGDSFRVVIDGLEPSHDERFVRAVVGGGVSILNDDYANFKTEEGVLRIVNDSRMRTTALFGAQFHLLDVPWWRRSKELSALVSLEFTQGTARILDGFQFGVGWEFNKYLTFVTGFALRKGEELSHGFEGAASQVIRAQQSSGNEAYAHFPVLPPDRTEYRPEELERLDGLPLTAPGATEPFFRGSPIVESYNRSIFLGFVVPINITSLLSPQ